MFAAGDVDSDNIVSSRLQMLRLETPTVARCCGMTALRAPTCRDLARAADISVVVELAGDSADRK